MQRTIAAKSASVGEFPIAKNGGLAPSKVRLDHVELLDADIDAIRFVLARMVDAR